MPLSLPYRPPQPVPPPPPPHPQPAQQPIILPTNPTDNSYEILDHVRKFYNNREPVRLNFDQDDKDFCYLDYVYVMKNEGILYGDNPEKDIPRHWHYIGLGLSDLHGFCQFYKLDEKLRENNHIYDKSVEQPRPYFPPNSLEDGLSGFGIELTFRLGCLEDEKWAKEPPLWPARLMSKMAEYMFLKPATFKRPMGLGDRAQFFEWLDPDQDNPKIEHIILTEDLQLQELETTRGKVKFLQLVGVVEKELQLAREWSSEEVLKFMQGHLETGGELLVTDMNRKVDILELNPSYRSIIDNGIKETGTDTLAMVMKYSVSTSLPPWYIEAEVEAHISDDESESRTSLDADETRIDIYKDNDCDNNEEQQDCVRKYGGLVSKGVEKGDLRTINRSNSYQQDAGNKIQNNNAYSVSRNLSRATSRLSLSVAWDYESIHENDWIDSIYLLLTFDVAKALLILLKNRLVRKNHFIFISDYLWTTFVPEGCVAMYKTPVSVNRPYVKIVREPEEVQVEDIYLYISEDLRILMVEELSHFIDDEDSESKLPKNFKWKDYKFHLTIVDELDD